MEKREKIEAIEAAEKMLTKIYFDDTPMNKMVRKRLDTILDKLYRLKCIVDEG